MPEEFATEKYVDDAIAETTKFSARKLGDTPTDMQQLTPKGYVDGQISSVISSVQAAISSINLGTSGWFGNGMDGNVIFDGTTAVTGASIVASGTYALTRDVYYNNVSVLGTASLKTAQYRPFVSGTLYGYAGATFDAKGNDASGPTAGVAVAAGYFPAMPAGLTGGSGGAGASGGGGQGGVGNDGQTAASVLNALGFVGVSSRSQQSPSSILGGAAGGVGAAFGGNAGGGGSVVGTSIALESPWSVSYLLDINSSGSTVKMNVDAASGSGPGGAGGSNTVLGRGGNGGSGGGSGSPGGILALYAKNLILSSGSTVTVAGGSGGNATNGSPGSIAGGGQGGGGAGGNGGSGGDGGLVLLVYNTIVNNASILYGGGAFGIGGTGAAGAAGGGAGGNGLAGFSGNNGSVIGFQIT